MPKYRNLGKYKVWFELRRWVFHLTVVELLEETQGIRAMKKLKHEPVYVAANIPIHINIGYGVLADRMAKGYWFDMTFFEKNIKEGERFKHGIHFSKVTKPLMHHPNHSKA